MRPLKLSQKPFCIGFPGAMKCQTTLLSCAQANTAFEVNSVPLSETIMPGLPRRSISAVTSRAPRRPAPPPSPSLAHRQAFFAIKPVDAVDARGLALLPQQDEQSPIAEALPFVGEIAQMRPKFCVRRSA